MYYIFWKHQRKDVANLKLSPLSNLNYNDSDFKHIKKLNKKYWNTHTLTNKTLNFINKLLIRGKEINKVLLKLYV
jgi:hypothetical protein